MEEQEGEQREVKMSATVRSSVNTRLHILSYLMIHLTRTCAPGASELLLL